MCQATPVYFFCVDRDGCVRHRLEQAEDGKGYLMPKSNTWWEQAVQNRLVAAVLAMIVFVPLVATPADNSHRGVAALVFEGFALVLLATLLWRSQWDLGREKVAAFLKTGANLPVLLLFGLSVISCLFSPHKGYSIQETLRLGAGVLLYFVVAYQFRRSEYLAKLVDALIFLAVTASLLGFAQFARNSEVFSAGMFGDHQLFGSFLMLLLPVIAVVAITETKTNRQLAAQIATILTGACLLLTHARSAWIGGAAGLVALGLMTMYALASRASRIGARKHEWALPVMLLFVAAGFFLKISPDAGSIMERADTLTQGGQIAAVQYRQTTARGAFAMLKARPLTGWGIGLYPYYQSAHTGTGATLTGQYTRPYLNEDAHNLYLQTAAELGVPGVLLLISIVVVFLGMGMGRVRSMEAGVRRNLLLGSMASLVAFAVDAAGSPAWQLGQNSMFLWLILGLGVSCLRAKPKPVEETAARVVPQRLSRSSAILACLALATLLPTIAFAGGGNYSQLVRVVISPKQVTLRGRASQAFTLTATFLDPGTGFTMMQDVTNSPNTTFSKDTNRGTLVGNVYTSVFRSRYTIRIFGTYTQGSGNQAQSRTDFANVTVRP